MSFNFIISHFRYFKDGKAKNTWTLASSVWRMLIRALQSSRTTASGWTARMTRATSSCTSKSRELQLFFKSLLSQPQPKSSTQKQSYSNNNLWNWCCFSLEDILHEKMYNLTRYLLFTFVNYKKYKNITEDCETKHLFLELYSVTR